MKKDEFETMKKELLEVRTGEEWNEFKERYPNVKFSEVDHEMKQHINSLIRSTATQEMLDNPSIHYEVRRKRK